ncbi:hypothetical protein AB0C07_26460 [Actinoplanes missouriensis]|uniref:hypothetical protein n=1 Tax=Actinoplanes missouriensis TaxID=1866 RepID=UPI0033ED45AC
MKRTLGAAAAITTGIVSAAVFAVPGTANAAQNNNVSATVPSSGNWYGGPTRHKTDTSVIKIKVLESTSGTLCIVLRKATDYNTIIGSERCWGPGDRTAKIMANSSGRVDFRIWSHKSSGGSDRTWTGIAYY